MQVIRNLFEVVMHLDKHLYDLINGYGSWTYAILFIIIFCETGLVVTPFLPGDSLLFAAGALAAITPMKVHWLLILLSLAAIIGDTLNYWIGHSVGPRVFNKEHSRLFNREHLERTRRFYEKYGAKTIIIARFVPIIRTFAPFVAGIGKMTYSRFITYNVVGGLLWITLLLMAGYFFGNIPVVKKNFTIVIFAIIILSVMPAVYEYLSNRYGKSG
ncbi:MAG: DedA family protein [Nitrospirae bacterium]|uniref:DedA family protein n=1 Tax=Candidatus Magnetobacterium casense TaxID=1455061 RepID=UPI0005905B28|nr:DedA family protein [Candidatus Magnetobacterium casensis]MBF0338234.1 DedA family protein [Nitrospirota bacterium]